MLFFPYKADVDLGRWPIFTLLVCAICIWVFARQAISNYEYSEALEGYCTREITRDELLVFKYVSGDPQEHYCGLLLEIREAPDRKRAMLDIAEGATQIPFYKSKTDSTDYIYSVLSESSRRFERAVPTNLTDELHYDPNTLNVGRMITAAFSHADLWHLLFNLIFFFAFAASVEVIAGHIYFAGFIVVSAIGTHLAYAYSVLGEDGALPTVGLSGVVMSMMAFLATVAPGLKIRCFFWLLIFVRVFSVPALALAALYIVQDVFAYMHRDPSDNVNYIAHISGAAIGIAMGLVYKIRNREFIRDLLSET